MTEKPALRGIKSSLFGSVDAASSMAKKTPFTFTRTAPWPREVTEGAMAKDPGSVSLRCTNGLFSSKSAMAQSNPSGPNTVNAM